MTSNKILDTLYTDSTIISKEITLETLYNEIEIIKDTLASVATNTEPSTFLWVDSSISNNTIGLIAAIFGIVATFFGYLGYKYQKISSEELKKMVPLGQPFFGGELIFTAEFVYLQYVRSLDCETTFLAIIA
ncbi:MAG: hypothetical protein E7080_01515 [Bacteroidales bacterium]|nr:hypothetical protein [Bacteroidales bacterium]